MKNGTKETILTKTLVVSLLALVCCALWGSAFPMIKLGYRAFGIAGSATATQILFAGCRFTLAGIFTILLGSVISRKVLLPKRESFGKILKLCMLQTVLQYLFFYIGLANTSGVKASILEGTNVFMAIFVASLLFHQEKLTAAKIWGSIIGFIGVVLVNLTGNGIEMSLNFFGDGFIILSTVAYAFSSVFLKRYSKDENPVVLSGYQFFAGGLVMIICGILAGGRLENVSGKGLLILMYLAMLSAVAYSLWGILLKYNPVSKVAVFGFSNSVFGVLFSMFLLNEKDMINIKTIIALVLVSIGIYVVNKKSKASSDENTLPLG